MAAPDETRAGHVQVTQDARALGLEGRYDEAHALLDGLPLDDPEVATRVALERGRLLRTAGSPEESRPYFDKAVATSRDAGLEALHVDALHMVALVVPPEEALARNLEALEVARASSDRAARDWDASLLNNIGMTHADAGDWEAALTVFQEALAARVRIGSDDRTRVARWMIGWTLRHLGRLEEARTVQTALKRELDAVGQVDPYVDEELALLQG